MQWNKFLQTWEGTRAENRFNRLVILGLIVLVLVFGSVALMKKTIVTVQPYTLTQEAWVTTNDASQNYKEAWGQFFAAEIGNVTPATVDFIKEIEKSEFVTIVDKEKKREYFNSRGKRKPMPLITIYKLTSKGMDLLGKK